MSDKIIASDGRLSKIQIDKLCAMLDTILPASDDGRLPSASEMPFVDYLERQDPDYFEVLIFMLETLDDEFVRADYDARYDSLQEISRKDQSIFNGLIRHVYTSYYENDRVMEAIGAQPGPPFPRGNTIEAGDLSLLDPVMSKPRSYRKGK